MGGGAAGPGEPAGYRPGRWIARESAGAVGEDPPPEERGDDPPVAAAPAGRGRGGAKDEPVVAKRRPTVWVPLSAYYFDDPALIAVGDAAELLFVRMLAYAARTPEREGP